ncbi:hypothetical protein QUF64_12425 [Anaerolineales bacterium HSG6]|nr:hypothetical protein [Anaerolineales bacterium HSG6]MDM8531960.1 hypothetical protein [Anaerolineales bacterium HSG25]
MAKKKKRKSNTPRRKRMSRPGRLSSAKSTNWIQKYEGKSLIRGYCKWYGVGSVCAIIELRMLGIEINDARLEEAKRTAESRAKQKAAKKKKQQEKLFNELYSDSDDTFCYIVGYTSGGAPYGLTWEQADETPPWLEDCES